MEITRIEKAGSGKERIWLNDEPAFVMTREGREEAGLEEGAEYTAEMEKKVTLRLQRDARIRCETLLSASDRPSRALTERLLNDGYPAGIAASVIGQLEKEGYVDDLRLAGRYIEREKGRKNRAQLTASLLGKGLSGEVIDEAFLEEGSPDERAQIRELARQRGYDPDAEEAVRQKFYQYLMRKGYSWRDIRSACQAE